MAGSDGRYERFVEHLRPALIKEKFPEEPLDIPHRIFVIHGRKPLAALSKAYSPKPVSK
ncbi:MAG: hypothetical protein V3S11_03945 [Elusimicrobiota bacterium]